MQFDRTIEFSQGVALVSRHEESGFAFINISAQPITPYKYDSAGTGRSACDELIRVCTKIYSPALQKALDSSDSIDYTDNRSGVSILVMKSGKRFSAGDRIYKSGFINPPGQEVIPPRFDQANDFHNGMAAVLSPPE